MSPERNRHAWPNPRHDPPVDNVKREVAGADQVDCGDGEAFEVVSAASGVLRVRLIGLVPSAFITQTSKSPSRLDVNAMRVPSGPVAVRICASLVPPLGPHSGPETNFEILTYS
jgi:hypothetical protein